MQRAQSFRREILCPKDSSSVLSAFVGNNFMLRDFTAEVERAQSFRREIFYRPLCLK